LLLPPAYHRIVENGENTSNFNRLVTRVLELALFPFAIGLGVDVHTAFGVRTSRPSKKVTKRMDTTEKMRQSTLSHEGYFSTSRAAADLYCQSDLHDWQRYEYRCGHLVHPAKDTQRDSSGHHDGYADDSRASHAAVHRRHY